MFVLEGHLIFDTSYFILPTESDERRALTAIARHLHQLHQRLVHSCLLFCFVVLETDRNRRITMKFTASALALAAPLMANGAFHFWEGFIELVENREGPDAWWPASRMSELLHRLGGLDGAGARKICWMPRVIIVSASDVIGWRLSYLSLVIFGLGRFRAQYVLLFDFAKTHHRRRRFAFHCSCDMRHQTRPF